MEGSGLPQWYIDYCRNKNEEWVARDSNDASVPEIVLGDVNGYTGVFRASRREDDNRITNLLRDVAFNKHSTNDGQHVSPADNGRLQVGSDGIVVKLVQGLDEAAFKRTLDMATRATIGMDLSKGVPGDWEHCEKFKEFWLGANHDGMSVRTDWPTQEMTGCEHTDHRLTRSVPYSEAKYEGQVAGGEWEEMLKGGLQTALESQVIVFAVSGASRTCTHQLVRSRRAAFHQQSQRASFYGVSPELRMPESVWRNPRARKAFLNAYAAAQEAYRVACEEDVSYQDARFVLPEGTTNYILCEYNVKEFRDVFAYRGCSMFSWEIVAVMREMRRLLVEAHPFLADSIKISCEKTGPKILTVDEGVRRGGYIGEPEHEHTCTFQGWERVEGQCDFPWARDDNRTFRSTTYEIGKRPVYIENDPPLTDVWNEKQLDAARSSALNLGRQSVDDADFSAPGPDHPAAKAISARPDDDVPGTYHPRS